MYFLLALIAQDFVSVPLLRRLLLKDCFQCVAYRLLEDADAVAWTLDRSPKVHAWLSELAGIDD